MPVTESGPTAGSLLASLLSDESFRPAEPASIEETGLTGTFIETLIIKYIQAVGASSGRRIAEEICLPFRILEPMYQTLRARQIIVHTGSAPLNDYNYTLTDQGRERAKSAMQSCAYTGAAPVRAKYRSIMKALMPNAPSGTRPISTVRADSFSHSTEPTPVPMENSASAKMYSVSLPPRFSTA